MTRKCIDNPKSSRLRTGRKANDAERQKMRQAGRARGQVLWLLVAAVFGLAVVGTAGGVWVMDRLQASLAQLDGEATVLGLAAAVRVERDALGIPTVTGSNRLDVGRALGFLHAQERFFQMDLLRRAAAGELAELIGPALAPFDRGRRVHRFRSRAGARLDALPAAHDGLIRAYTGGVNAGLETLEAPPFEYFVLRVDPQPWRPEDTLLAIYAMYFDLQDEAGRHESTLGLMHDVLPLELYEFLTPQGSEWDAPMIGGPLAPPPPPPPEVFDLREREALTSIDRAVGAIVASGEESFAGSNNWALSGSRSGHGGALLAGDMHLSIRVPNIWYRASLVYPNEAGGQRKITGVTLPGVPLLVAGSTGDIAWAFTNSYGDWSDLVVLEPAGEGAYRSPAGVREFEIVEEIIRVKGEDPQTVDVVTTVWGPVIDTDHAGRNRALRWVAHDPEAVNLEMFALERAHTAEEALGVAMRAGMPAQNFVVADRDGHIGWTVAGPIPRRFGHDGRLPRSWADGDAGWDGWLPPAEYPRIVDPPDGVIWTANARVVAGEPLAKLGDGGYPLGAHPRQIRDGLLAVEHADEAAMLALQLDDRALFLARWRNLLLDVLSPEALAADPRRRQLRQAVAEWGGHAAVDSVGYRMVRAFRTRLAEQVFAPLVAACGEVDAAFVYGIRIQIEAPLWRLVEEQPPHLLDPRYANWSEQFLAAVDALLDVYIPDGGSLDEYTWGELNTSHFTHPMSSSLPVLGPWLDLPSLALPGDADMPRVQTPTAGASQRMVVSPGREELGIFHMPGGQSGHPLSPHYRDGHAAWAGGEPTPFLPGSAVHKLVLMPAGER